MLADEAGGVLALYRADNQTDANNTLEQYSLRIVYMAMSVRRVCMQISMRAYDMYIRRSRYATAWPLLYVSGGVAETRSRDLAGRAVRTRSRPPCAHCGTTLCRCRCVTRAGVGDGGAAAAAVLRSASGDYPSDADHAGRSRRRRGCRRRPSVQQQHLHGHAPHHHLLGGLSQLPERQQPVRDTDGFWTRWKLCETNAAFEERWGGHHR